MPDLAALPSVVRRMTLTCVVLDDVNPVSASEREAAWASLEERTWAPTPDDTPVAWAGLQAFYERVMARKAVLERNDDGEGSQGSC